MKIYLAGLYETAISAVHRNPDHRNRESIGELKYPCILESFFYVRHGPTMQVIRERGEKIFLDSGAFSMFTQGEDVDLESYADFIKEHHDIIEVASNLDKIGRGGEVETYENQKSLERMGVDICPVHHARDEDSWLERYLDEGYEYIFFGGMVPETTQYLKKWLDRVWSRYLTNPDGTAKVKVHGFGLTTGELMHRYPWYSVDSTRWVMAAAMGTILHDHERHRVISVSDAGPTLKQKGRNLLNLSQYERDHFIKLIESHGFHLDQLVEDYAWRWRWNIEFYRRQMEMHKPITFKQTQTELF